MGHLYKFELNKFGLQDYFFTVTYLKEATLANIRSFSSQSYEYGKIKRSNKLPLGIFGGYWSFSIILVDELESSVKQAIEFVPPSKHWASCEFPVVIEINIKKVLYVKETPAWGMFYYEDFRKLASEITSFLVS